MNRRFQLWLWAALAITIGLAMFWQFAPLPNAGERLSRLPLSGLGFTGKDLPLSDIEKSVFQRAQTIKRLYKAGNQVFIVQVIDASGDRHAIHDPLYCFRGAGWEVASSQDLSVNGGTARQLQLRRNAETAEIVYWISDGTVRHASPIRYRWQTALRRLSMGRSGLEPVLVLVQPADNTVADWSTVFSRFPALLDL